MNMDRDARTRTFGQWWDSNERFVRASIEDLKRVGAAAYESVGASPGDAIFLFDTNLDKAIQGDHARGLGKLPGLVAAARAGRLDVSPKIEIVRERSATAVVDGGPAASGRLVCRFGMDIAITKAREHGVGWVGARSSGEILTPYVSQAVDAGMVALVMVQSFPSVAPLGGYEPLLGNGPIAFGVPAKDRDPVILDMSTTQSSASGMLMAAEQEEHVARGLLLDQRGEPTTDAQEFPDRELMEKLGGGFAVRGTLLPLGGSHKGAGLVFIVGLLSHLLTDTSPPWELFYDLPERGRYGTILVAVDPTAFDPSGEVLSKVDAFIDRVTSAPRKAGAEEILYPGQRSQQLKRERRESGFVELPESHFEGMCVLARELGIEQPTTSGASSPEGNES
ncbi:MAG: Ldh family oxidoreductase [Deltaproteobacteria bacterium]|nr:Ldh family oxidoreductase [Deltaproteobacteria bacterium]